MAKNKQSRKLRIATLALSAIMSVAASSFLFTACSQTTEDEDTKTETRTDTQTFANGNFEYFSDNDGAYRIASPESWTSSSGSNDSGVSASSSVAKSGIVDTSFNWNQFYDAYNTYNEYKDIDDDEDVELPDPYYTDIDNNYDIPGWDVAKAAAEDDQDPDEAAIKEAASAINPGTPFAAKETEDETNGTHVLMLHNYRSNKMGTASRYTSSSITLAAGTAAEISVWVKTAQMSYNDGKPVDGNRGAYIKINNTVGGASQDALVVRNIDTAGVESNNGWVQYTFYINASPYATTTFTVELGLGMQAEGKDTNKYEYVQGYAFFDDLKYTVMQSKDFDEAVSENVPANQALKLDLSYGSDLSKLDASAATKNYFSIDLDSTNLSEMNIPSVSATDTVDSRGNTVATYFKDSSSLTANAAQDKNLSGLKQASALTEDNGYTKNFVKDFEKFNSLAFGGSDKNVLVLYSSLGAPYTATLNNDNVSGAPFKLAKDKSMLISFWVKTFDLQGGTGATVTLVDGETETSIGAVDTTTLTAVSLVDDEKKADKATLKQYEDIFDGWQQCFFFVTNTTDKELEFSLKFSYGPTTISGTTLSSYQEGYAAFTGFAYQQLSDEEYAVKSTGTYAVEVSLKGDEVTSSNSFDDVAYTDSETIKTDVADPRNYKGVYGNSTYVGGAMLEDPAMNAENAYANAGLINKDYTDEGNGYDGSLGWMSVLKANYPTYADAIKLSNEMWNAIFGEDCNQPLLIANTVKQAYGFVGTSTSISSSSYTQVTLRVKLSGKTTANIYLIESSAKDKGEKLYTDTLKYSSGVSYRYDKDGNVVSKEPSDKDFNAKTDTLLYKQSNGLWSTTKDHSGDVWYANLTNFQKDDDGNLIDSDKNIVYYVAENEQEKADGIYYRYKTDNDTLEVKVKDFTASDVDLTGATVQSAVEKQLSRTVYNDSDSPSDWIYVRFFIASGDESKNYRLEVWSGSRDAQTQNNANTFVAFDVVSYSSLDQSSFDSLVSENLDEYAQSLDLRNAEELKESYEKNPDTYINGTDTQLVYYHYSLFDDDDYKSFDANYSEDSDSYADYDPSTYSNSVSYFNYRHDIAGTEYYDTFVNYSTYEVTVATSTEDDTTTEEDTANTPEYNVWLLVASIVLAIVLVFTLIALLIRKLLANIRKKSVHNKPMYDNKRKRYIRKLRLEESEHDESSDDVLPDEDEISEDDIYKVDDTEENQQPEELKQEISEEEIQQDSPSDDDGKNNN